MTSPATPPAGYTRREAAGCEVVALEALLPVVVEALSEGTLYDYARGHPRARPLAGRGVAYAVQLPDGRTSVVVRHSRHGGALARVTGDRFLGATRAAHELAVAVYLRARHVRTPVVVAYVTYPAGPFLRRADVATREIPKSRDLATALLGRPDPATKALMLAATGRLLAALAAAGARHCDLNLKNVLIAPDAGDAPAAYVLDVDRVRLRAPHAREVVDGNFSRFARSARKWRTLYGADIDEDDLARLRAAAGGP